MPKSQQSGRSEGSRREPYKLGLPTSSAGFLEVPGSVASGSVTSGSVSSSATRKKAKRAAGRRDRHASQKSTISAKLGLLSGDISVLYRTRDAAHEAAVLGRCLDPSDPLFLDYKRISAPGTVYIVDKDSLEPHLIVRITPFSHIGPDREDFSAVFSHLSEDSRFKYNITRNGAMVDGEMFGLGWRAGYDAGVSMGTYAVVLKTKEDEEKWRVLKEQERRIHDIYGRRFCSLAPTLFENNAEYLAENSLPYIGYEYNERFKSQDYLFASNLTYTRNNFHNAAHHDYDASEVTYGIWAPCGQFGRLASEADGFTKTDGFFYVAPYKIIIDFAAVDGVVELIWMGATDAHSTVKGTVSEGFVTWGSSCQTSQHLVDRIKKALKSVSDTIDIRVKHN